MSLSTEILIFLSDPQALAGAKYHTVNVISFCQPYDVFYVLLLSCLEMKQLQLNSVRVTHVASFWTALLSALFENVKHVLSIKNKVRTVNVVGYCPRMAHE